MKKKLTAISRQRSAMKKPPASLEFDTMCALYQEAEAARAHLWKQLYTRARREGAALKDAPRSRLLAGVRFEALASLATRTDVDQVAAGRAQTRLSYAQYLAMSRVFSADTVWILEPAWERMLAHLPAKSRESLRARVLACLRTRPVKRLTVRKRKLTANSRQLSAKERAA